MDNSVTCSEYCLERLGEAEQHADAGKRDEAIANFRGVAHYASAWKILPIEAAAPERLGDVERERRNLYAAENEYREAIALWAAVLPAGHWHLACLRGSLAIVCHELRHFGDADLIASSALRLAEAACDPVAIAIARNNLVALRLVSPSPWLAAEPLALQIRESCGTEACAPHNLGVLECFRGRYREAACLLAWAETMLENEVGPDAEVVRACRENLARVRALECCPAAEALTA